MINLLVDSVGMDSGSAFLSADPYRPGPRDCRIDGRFGRAEGGRVYLETYDSADLGIAEGEPFASVYVEAATRRGCIVKLLRALGYPTGQKFSIRYERN